MIISVVTVEEMQRLSLLCAQPLGLENAGDMSAGDLRSSGIPGDPRSGGWRKAQMDLGKEEENRRKIIGKLGNHRKIMIEP